MDEPDCTGLFVTVTTDINTPDNQRLHNRKQNEPKTETLNGIESCSKTSIVEREIQRKQKQFS